MLDSLVAAGVFTGPHADPSGAVQLEIWQVINLIGAPMLAVLFARPVIDDLRAWFSSRHEPNA